MKKKDDNKTIPYIAIAAVVMLLSIIIIYSLGKNAANMIISNTLTSTFAPGVDKTPQPAVAYVPQSPKPTVYTSKKLGISFTYDANMSNQNVSVKEEENKVYIFVRDAGQTTIAEKYVEVLSKNPSDSIEQAIQKIILKGYSPSDCLVAQSKSMQELSKDLPDYTKTYIVAGIKFPVEGSTTFEEQVQLAKKCPEKYAAVNSVKRFVMDTQHPDRLLFLDIGQDTFLSGLEPNYSWDETIRFVK